MRQFLAIIIVGLSGVLASMCDAQAVGIPIKPVALYAGQVEGRLPSTRAVITDRLEFERVWNQAHANSSSTVPLPPIDFTKETVIVAGLGLQGGLFASIRITDVQSDGVVLRIKISVVVPGFLCISPSVQNYPTTIARIPNIGLTPVFSDTVVVDLCK
jgi:hypothetical protein